MTAMNDTLDVTRPLPPLRSVSKPFWDATREKKVVIQYDAEVGKYQFYPRPTSIFTGRTKHLEWREVSGKGQIFTYTIARRARPPFREHEPFFVAMVTLDEDVNIMGNIVNCSEEEMKVGLRVKPFWTPLSDGRNLLLFEPDNG